MNNIKNPLIIYFLCLAALSIRCSEDKKTEEQLEPVPECERPSQLHLEQTWGFTGQLLTINGNFPCLDGLQKVLANGIAVELASKTETKVSITLPKGMTGKITLQVVAGGEKIDVSETLTVYPGGGKFVEIASFPGQTREQSQTFNTADKAYLLGGYWYRNFDHGIPDIIFENDIYAYEPTANTWSYITDFNDAAYIDYGFYNGMVYRFFLGGGPDHIFDPTSGTVSSPGHQPGWGKHGFVLTGNYYSLFSRDLKDPVSSVIVLKKFDADTGGQMVAEAATSYGPQFSFGFSYNNKGYFGVWEGSGNQNAFSLWEFDPAVNTLVKKKTMLFDTSNGAIGARFLFTANNQAYFLPATGRFLPSPIEGYQYEINRNPLLIYNFEVNEWIRIQPDVSEELMNSVAFSVGNRNFVGMSEMKSSSTATSHSNRFFEFIPE